MTSKPEVEPHTARCARSRIRGLEARFLAACLRESAERGRTSLPGNFSNYQPACQKRLSPPSPFALSAQTVDSRQLVGIHKGTRLPTAASFRRLRTFFVIVCHIVDPSARGVASHQSSSDRLSSYDAGRFSELVTGQCHLRCSARCSAKGLGLHHPR